MKSKLPKKEQEDLLIDLVNALTLTKNLDDVILFVQDLLTKSELEMLSKRLRIAKLLLRGMTYDEIAEMLHASQATVAKIATWLSERGDGFRNIIAKLPQKKHLDPLSQSFGWDQVKRKYSLYFWPELLLEEIIKGASKRQKERITDLLDTLGEKSELHRRIEQLLRQTKI